MIRYHSAVLLLVLFALCGTFAQPLRDVPAVSDSISISAASDEEAVKAAVERFLVAIGNYELDALPPMFLPNANIGAAALREGKRVPVTYTFEEFLATLKARKNPKGYQEPVSHFTVHVEQGALAFVRADATLISDSTPRSHNIDYFTLLKDDGVWKFLSASYIATPISTQ